MHRHALSQTVHNKGASVGLEVEHVDLAANTDQALAALSEQETQDT